MTAQSKTIIKTYFQTGDKPLESEFADLIDSYQDSSIALQAIATAAVSATAGYMVQSDGAGSVVFAAPPSGISMLIGDVITSGAGIVSAAIASGAVGLGQMALLQRHSIIANPTSAAATPTALQVSANTVIAGASDGALRALTLGGITVTTTSFSRNMAPDFEVTAALPAAGGLIQAAHGFGSSPGMVRIYGQCVSADGGYVAGDRVENLVFWTNGAASIGPTIFSDATNINVRFGSTNSISLGNKATGAAVIIDVDCWNVIIVGYRRT